MASSEQEGATRMDERAKLRALALALLTNGQGITRKSGQFLGQLCAPDHYPLTPRQHQWLGQLADKGGMSEQFAGIEYVEG